MLLRQVHVLWRWPFPPAGSLPPPASLTSSIREGVGIDPSRCSVRTPGAGPRVAALPDSRLPGHDSWCLRTDSSERCSPSWAARAGPPTLFVPNRKNRMESTKDLLGGARLIFGLLVPLVAGCVTGADEVEPVVDLITKTEDNPFFVTMREGAIERAGELGVELRAFAGRFNSCKSHRKHTVRHPSQSQPPTPQPLHGRGSNVGHLTCRLQGNLACRVNTEVPRSQNTRTIRQTPARVPQQSVDLDAGEGFGLGAHACPRAHRSAKGGPSPGRATAATRRRESARRRFATDCSRSRKNRQRTTRT